MSLDELGDHKTFSDAVYEIESAIEDWRRGRKSHHHLRFKVRKVAEIMDSFLRDSSGNRNPRMVLNLPRLSQEQSKVIEEVAARMAEERHISWESLNRPIGHLPDTLHSQTKKGDE